MPCYRPLQAWRTTDDTVNGKKRIAFKKSANSTTPLTLPCGRCIGCKLTRSYNWAIRCTHEAQLHQENSFITLTYSDEHLPWDGSLVKQHFQKFIKRLRKSSDTPIRYYMAGEYGTQLSRPHYHACLFGHSFPDQELLKETEGLYTYTSATLDKLWNKGFSTVTEMSFETAAYAARYCTKKITGKIAEDHYTRSHPLTGEILHLEPEYNTMSLKPGIATEWFEKYKSDVYPSDYLISKNKKTPPPRFYDKLFEISGGDMEEIQKQRKKRAAKNLADNTPERLATREKSKHLSMRNLSRSYET